MNIRTQLERLINNADIPDDSIVVSENNKIVTISPRERIVSRIGNLANTKLRDDPHDLSYSHTAAWLAGDVAPTVKPLHESPIISGEYVISHYPLLNNKASLDTSRAAEIFAMTRDLGSALPVVEAGMTLRKIDISGYVQERIDHMTDNPSYDQELVHYINSQAQTMQQTSPFHQLTQADRALIHGDLKADNVVIDSDGSLKTIDLDAVAVGPRLYDLASWRLRSEMGDAAPIEEAVAVGRKSGTWNEDAYRALIGWKAISSMSFTLRYESPDVHQAKIAHIAHSATSLGGLTAKPATTDN